MDAAGHLAPIRIGAPKAFRMEVILLVLDMDKDPVDRRIPVGQINRRLRWIMEVDTFRTDKETATEAQACNPLDSTIRGLTERTSTKEEAIRVLATGHRLPANAKDTDSRTMASLATLHGKDPGSTDRGLLMKGNIAMTGLPGIPTLLPAHLSPLTSQMALVGLELLIPDRVATDTVELLARIPTPLLPQPTHRTLEIPHLIGLPMVPIPTDRRPLDLARSRHVECRLAAVIRRRVPASIPPGPPGQVRPPRKVPRQLPRAGPPAAGASPVEAAAAQQQGARL